ncbi:MAG: GT4 family glycosyltransferase PelF [Vicinamibacteria bacterium]
MRTILFAVESMERAGAEQVVLSLVSGLDRDRFRPVVCCLTERGELADRVEEQGAPVIPLFKHPRFDLPVIPRLVSVLRRHRVDLVHSHVWPANVWGRVVGTAVRTRALLVTEHNVDLWKRRSHLVLDRFLARVTDRILCVSRAVERFYREEAGIDPRKLLYVPNGIDPLPFQREVNVCEKRRELGLDPRKPLVTVVARLLPQKHHTAFLRAMKLLEERSIEASGLIVGDGRLRAELEAEASGLGLSQRVFFAGERRDVPAILGASDVVALSSIHEGMPLAILEAMAAGKPAVVTDVGGNREIVEDGVTGFIVPPRDPAALASAIERLLRSPDLGRKLGASGRSRVQREFSLEAMVRRNQEIYDEVLDPTAARTSS